MTFAAMVSIVTIDLGFAFRAEAGTLVHTGTYHMEFFSPWGEPPLTEESGPLRSALSLGNHSSIQPIIEFDEKMFPAPLQRLSVDSDESATVILQAPGDILTEKAQSDSKTLRPVVFSFRPNRGGRIVRPESVLELNDDDIVSTTESASASRVEMRKCPWQCGDNSIECNLMTAVCSLQANRVCVGARCRRKHLGTNAFSGVTAES
eukprot:gnl/MRDRNA2_/MRDRNA2_89031_c0_seq1.p1 gnl/MRDRNA2_/MRDRNA2_89031_c0~~gnl/MRDRNA2_/MRDRNA2_89031_c0_seq1.p1  ORF type:complete len:232 (+),score=27.55 gnl/MRDRNA2_/MRDRNA2_89031_c0_seq1:80-697(+)